MRFDFFRFDLVRFSGVVQFFGYFEQPHLPQMTTQQTLINFVESLKCPYWQLSVANLTETSSSKITGRILNLYKFRVQSGSKNILGCEMHFSLRRRSPTIGVFPFRQASVATEQGKIEEFNYGILTSAQAARSAQIGGLSKE